MKRVPERRKKPRVPYMPRFSGSPFEGKAYNMVKKVYPSLVFKGLEFEDLLQEAAVVFLVCREKYRGKVDNPAWFMALFIRALGNRFVDLQRSNFPYISLEEISELEEPSSEYHAGYCWRILQELPEDIRELLQVLMVDDSVLPDLRDRFRALAAGPQPTKKEI